MNACFGLRAFPRQPLHARFLARFCRSAKGRYPPNRDMERAIRNLSL